MRCREAGPIWKGPPSRAMGPDIQMEQQGASFARGMGRIFERACALLHDYRPRLTQWQFWVVQGLVAIVAGLHYYAEIEEALGYATGAHALSFVHVSLFFIPLVYAALNFGLVGTIGTALLVVAITIPNIVLYHPTGFTRAAESVNLATVAIVALFVGYRVEKETAARHRAEQAREALGVSESKYRGLFESSPVSILVLDPRGNVLEGNPASKALFGKGGGSLVGLRLGDLIGEEQAGLLLGRPEGEGPGNARLLVLRRNGEEVYLDPRITRTQDQLGVPTVQVVLRDVTAEHRRHEGMRAYAAYVQRAQEDERQRIAHELHDDVVQSLVMICRRLDIVEKKAWAGAQPAADGIRAVRTEVEEVMSRLRDFARTLRPVALEDLGLVMAIRRLVSDLSDRTGIRQDFRVLGTERRLSPDVELAIFRIAQELLRNVEYHAQATHVSATISFTPQGTDLEVSDNGVGMSSGADIAQLASRGHLGLLGVQERVELLDGRVEIESASGRGTTVRLHIPIV